MSQHRNPQERSAKILRFPLLRSRRAVTSADDAEVNDPRVLERRRRRAAAWLGGACGLLAWIVALSRLRFATLHHEVFGVESTMAFLVVVSMPLIHAGRLATSFREALSALRRVSTSRRGAAPRAPENHILCR